MRKFIPLIIITFLTACLISCRDNQTEKNTDKTSSSDDAINFARKMYGDNVYLLVRGDLNSNGKPDALAAVINKQLEEMKYWIQRGGVMEKGDDGWKLVLRMDERVSGSKGIFNEIPESRNGYILSFGMEKNPVTIRAAIADAKGQASSEEFAFKWNELDGSYELEK